MSNRFVGLLFGIAFSATLAVVVGQRLSAESMAVLIGVVAGVSASIPTSLIVVWFAVRASRPQQVVEVSAARAAAPSEPRIVVLAQQPQSAPAYQHYAGWAPQRTAQPPAAQFEQQAILPPRHFTLVGGEPGFEPWEEVDHEEQVAWHR
jgi:hypothetical protein